LFNRVFYENVYTFDQVILADMKGEAIPKGWAVDKDGNDTVECSKMYGIHPVGGKENTCK
jgi:LDH2 family malate/lactate/ureidoglycolate dehydrogenase